MTPMDIEELLFDYLSGDGQIMYSQLQDTDPIPVPVLWMNETQSGRNPPKVPRIEINRTSDNDRIIGQVGTDTASVTSSSLVITIVTDRGSYLKGRSEILRSIWENLPLRKEIGSAMITRNPEARPGFLNGSEYRTPVFIAYDAILQ